MYMSDENITKRQHFVPRVYLKNFAFAKNETGENKYVYVFDKKSKKTFTPSIENICVENYLYDFDTEDVEQIRNRLLKFGCNVDISELSSTQQYVEKSFFANKVESQMFLPIKKIIENSKESSKAILSNDELVTLHLYIRIQYKRTISFKNTIDGVIDSFNTQTKHMEKVEKLIDNQMLFLSALMSNDIESLLKNINDYSTFFVRNETAVDYVTSASPVVLFNPMRRNSGVGYENIETIIMFPISPKLLIIIVKNKFLQGETERNPMESFEQMPYNYRKKETDFLRTIFKKFKSNEFNNIYEQRHINYFNFIHIMRYKCNFIISKKDESNYINEQFNLMNNFKKF